MHHEYAYKPLPIARSIRLVEFHPPNISTPGAISSSLCTVGLDDAPPFDALSYTWGDPLSLRLADGSEDYNSLCHKTICDGQIFLVRRNLLQALMAMRGLSFSPVGKTKQRYVWIDAICIDQSSHAERASQVGLMGNLYSRAESVIVWLGPDDGTVADAIYIAEHLATFAILPRTRDDYAIAKQTLGHISLRDFFDPDAYRAKLGSSVRRLASGSPLWPSSRGPTSAAPGSCKRSRSPFLLRN